MRRGMRLVTRGRSLTGGRRLLTTTFFRVAGRATGRAGGVLTTALGGVLTTVLRAGGGRRTGLGAGCLEATGRFRGLGFA